MIMIMINPWISVFILWYIAFSVYFYCCPNYIWHKKPLQICLLLTWFSPYWAQFLAQWDGTLTFRKLNRTLENARLLMLMGLIFSYGLWLNFLLKPNLVMFKELKLKFNWIKKRFEVTKECLGCYLIWVDRSWEPLMMW